MEAISLKEIKQSINKWPHKHVTKYINMRTAHNIECWHDEKLNTHTYTRRQHKRNQTEGTKIFAEKIKTTYWKSATTR